MYPVNVGDDMSNHNLPGDRVKENNCYLLDLSKNNSLTLHFLAQAQGGSINPSKTTYTELLVTLRELALNTVYNPKPSKYKQPSLYFFSKYKLEQKQNRN